MNYAREECPGMDISTYHWPWNFGGRILLTAVNYEKKQPACPLDERDDKNQNYITMAAPGIEMNPLVIGKSVLACRSTWPFTSDRSPDSS